MATRVGGKESGGAPMSKNGGAATTPATLPRTVTVPAGSVLYLPISVDPREPAAMTAVFSPKGYTAGADANVILYLHGNHNDDPKKGTPYTPSMTVEKYLGLSHFAALLDAITNSKPFKNLLFVAPSLGPTAQADTLLAKGIDWYLGEVLQGSQRHGVHRGQAAPPALKNLVLACHSGGGRVMLALAQGMTAKPPPAAAGALRECWGFDCLYDDFPVIDIESTNPKTKAKWTLADFAPSGCEQGWRQFARVSTSTRIFMHWLERKTRNKNLDKLVKWSPQATNLVVDPAFYSAPPGSTADPTPVSPPPTTLSVDHNYVPKDYFPVRLKALVLK
jgi:hypothetical protein